MLVCKVSMCDRLFFPIVHILYIQVKQENEKCRELDSGVDWIVRFLLAVILCEWQVAGGDGLLNRFRSEKWCRCADVNVNEDDVLIKDYEGAWIKK